MEYEPVIGLEVHVQLNTESKIFCGCATRFGAEPNSQTCPVCLGLPGVLPVLNEEVLRKAVLAGLALHSTVSGYSKFDRKNYFYPDLPKAYQISQYDQPVCKEGFLEIIADSVRKRIGITRLHLEEDAGKSIHSDDPAKNISYVDLNRTGIPLLEIVSEPDLRTGEEAFRYLQKLRSILKYIQVSDVIMEEGSLRCDVNISMRPKGNAQFGQKVEIKNLNSFKAVRSSIQYEIKRQTGMIESGEKIMQETRLWDDSEGVTCGMRLKEYAHDYRYFPDPDLPPVMISAEYISRVMESLPELPDLKRERFVSQYGLPGYDAEVLTAVRELAGYYEDSVKAGANPKKASNWIMSELLAKIDDPEKITSFAVTPSKLAALLGLVDDGTISGKIAKIIFDEMIATGKNPDEIVEEKGLRQVTDTAEIASLIDSVIQKNQDIAAEYRAGKEKALKFLMGQVMKESGGRANPRILNELLLKKLR